VWPPAGEFPISEVTDRGIKRPKGPPANQWGPGTESRTIGPLGIVRLKLSKGSEGNFNFPVRPAPSPPPGKNLTQKAPPPKESCPSKNKPRSRKQRTRMGSSLALAPSGGNLEKTRAAAGGWTRLMCGQKSSPPEARP